MIIRVYVHKGYESFGMSDLIRIYFKTCNTDITDVVCLSFWRTKYFHGRSDLYSRYPQTYLDRYCFRYM